MKKPGKTEQVKPATTKAVKDFIKKGVAANAAVKSLEITEKKELPLEGKAGHHIILYNRERRQIDVLRDLRPKKRGTTRAAISVVDWVYEAIQEKIIRDFAANNLNPEDVR